MTRRRSLPGLGAPLAQHLTAVRQQRAGAVEGLVAWLADRPLWTAERDDGPLLSVLPDGTRPALAVFSSLERLRRRTADARACKQPGRVLLERVAREHAGLVLDTSGPRPQALTAAELRGAL